ncbi:MAG: hypothetical protein HWN67_03870, partial [Candidatus Helarchaeota archaeon]|nr:hypothetical protein [Candidatus Helarchaeota archaeon]
VNQLQTDVKIFSVKDLYKKIEELENFDFSQPFIAQPIISQVIESLSPSTEKAVQKETVSTLRAPIPTMPVKQVVKEVPSEEKISEGDWSESELEGAKIFDELITGWKQRDWEKIGGTREIFMAGWAKLSSYDKKKIRSGTWSKQIINKIKLLGRERKV